MRAYVRVASRGSCVARGRDAAGRRSDAVAAGDQGCIERAADDVTPILYAQKTGMFAKAGLDVDLQKFNSGSAVTAAVIGGAIDIGKSSIIPLINAHVHGVPLQIVASGELRLTNEPISGMIVKKDSPITSARDLVGKTVAVVALGDLTHTGVRAWLDQNGVNSKSVRYLELPSSAVLAALNDGRIDAANVSNPIFTQIVSSGQVRIISPACRCDHETLSRHDILHDGRVLGQERRCRLEVRASLTHGGRLHEYAPCGNTGDDRRLLRHRSGGAECDESRIGWVDR